MNNLMYKKIFHIAFLVVLFVLSNWSCAQTNEKQSVLINTSHLDSLYEDINVENKSMGIIHIYSDYPDYKWIGDDDEGIACVDDAARAAVFYLKHYQFKNDNESLRKAKKLLQFLLFMQAENGYFYNFIWPDHSINKTFKTSVAEPNWWSWRAVWALMEGYEILKQNDKPFASEIIKKVELTVNKILIDIPQKLVTKEVKGFKRPTWLPSETASDQGALLLLGLTEYYKNTNRKEIYEYCKNLADGIILMQEGDKHIYPYGAILSWENMWHGWGNLQAYSLLKFYEVKKYKPAETAALREINNFDTYLIDQSYLSEITFDKTDNKTLPRETKQFSQIAYIIRPMVYACLEAYKITQDEKYSVMAGVAGNWFFGNNIVNKQMYFPQTGICYDGINSKDEVNKNSGAESTIEALLTILEINKYPKTRNEVEQYVKNNKMNDSK